MLLLEKVSPRTLVYYFVMQIAYLVPAAIMVLTHNDTREVSDILILPCFYGVLPMAILIIVADKLFRQQDGQAALAYNHPKDALNQVAVDLLVPTPEQLPGKNQDTNQNIKQEVQPTKTLSKEESPKKLTPRPKKESTKKKADEPVEKKAVDNKVKTNSEDEEKPTLDMQVKSPSQLDALAKASTVVVKVEPEDQADDKQGDSTPHVDAQGADAMASSVSADTKKKVEVKVEVTDSPKVTLDMGAAKQNAFITDDAAKDSDAASSSADTENKVKVEITDSPTDSSLKDSLEDSSLKTAPLDLGVPTPETASMDFIVPKPPAAPMDLGVPAPDVTTTTAAPLDVQPDTSKSKGKGRAGRSLTRRMKDKVLHLSASPSNKKQR